MVSLDTAGISSRVVAVPVAEARYRSLRAVKDGLAWLRAPVAGMLGDGAAEADGRRPRASLERFSLRERELTVVADELDWFAVSGDGTRLVIRDGDELRVLPAGQKPDDASDDKGVTVDLTRARLVADPGALWRHAFGEVGRLVRRDFWRADLAGVDWDGVLDRYRPLVDRVRGAADFADLLWELQGELGTSHAYVREPDGDWPEHGRGRQARRGHLPRRFRAVADRPGTARRVVRPDGALAAAGAGRRGAGRRRDRRGGRPAGPAGDGPWPLLAGAAGKPVELTVRSGPDDPVRRAVVVPLRDDRRLRYQDWVAGRRQAVRELGGGRVGYLHVPDMVAPGWAQFHRDLRTEMSHDAVIIDVRGNSGGHTSELIVEQLARRIVAWDMGRYRRPVSYPRVAPRGPVVTVADEFAGSDGDIVTAAIRRLRHRPGGRHPHLGWRGRHRRHGGGWSTAPRSPSPGTRSGSASSAGASRTTASTRTSKSSTARTTMPRAVTRSWRAR